MGSAERDKQKPDVSLRRKISAKERSSSAYSLMQRAEGMLGSVVQFNSNLLVYNFFKGNPEFDRGTVVYDPYQKVSVFTKDGKKYAVRIYSRKRLKEISISRKNPAIGGSEAALEEIRLVSRFSERSGDYKDGLILYQSSKTPGDRYTSIVDNQLAIQKIQTFLSENFSDTEFRIPSVSEGLITELKEQIAQQNQSKK